MGLKDYVIHISTNIWQKIQEGGATGAIAGAAGAAGASAAAGITGVGSKAGGEGVGRGGVREGGGALRKELEKGVENVTKKLRKLVEGKMDMLMAKWCSIDKNSFGKVRTRVEEEEAEKEEGNNGLTEKLFDELFSMDVTGEKVSRFMQEVLNEILDKKWIGENNSKILKSSKIPKS